MTTSRIVRGNKGRIFAYLVAVVVITGVIACYNNTLSQLDEAKLSKEVCQRESDTLSNQLHSKFQLTLKNYFNKNYVQFFLIH